MIISCVKQVSDDCVKITVSSGPAFFIRLSYLKTISPACICDNAELSKNDEEEILEAAFCFVAEKKAQDYILRAEQCRFSLERKLLAKGFEKRHIENALNYLEKNSLLSDKRYAKAWLNTRRTKYEGRKKLNNLLISRGIKKEDAKLALDDFFNDFSESDICKKGAERYIQKGMNSEELFKMLIKQGFSKKMISETLEEIAVKGEWAVQKVQSC